MNNKTTVFLLSRLLSDFGIRDVVTSPGSRNVPIIVGMAGNKNLRLHSVVDERCAGFVALGMSLKNESPVALVCTSGTALLNYAPAVSEAYYRNLPLIIITADRPRRWIDQDDGQTIRQNGALGNIVKGSFEIPADVEMKDWEWYANRIINEALIEALDDCAGPVHINIPLEEPLKDISPEELQTTQIAGYRKIELIRTRPVLPLAEVKAILSGYENKRIGVVVGTNRPDARLNKALQRVSTLSNVVVFHEAQSNVNGLERSVSTLDAVINSFGTQEPEEYPPDVLISIGGTLVSKSFKQFARSASKSSEHWYIGANPDKGLIDCFQNLTKYLAVDAPSFLNGMHAVIKRNNRNDNSGCGEEKNGGFSEKWITRQKKVKALVSEYQKEIPWCDFKAVCELVDHLPGKVNLHVSNGLSIRYVQNTDYTRLHRIDCNRGCNGIEGSTSTAMGAALNSNIPTVLLTGDMSALYDLGGLALDIVPKNFTVFVLNNCGGKIFRDIKAVEPEELRERFLSHPVHADFKKIALAFGYEYRRISNIDELKSSCKLIRVKSDGPRLFEIDTTENSMESTFPTLYRFINSNL